ncbi:MAG: hypothetical protein A3I05_07175 [Deltaproteobacteria bacterium RIFCSPLOWO2_02_FULL_44_10]|nr:MAG: hypothetical protein A3C46_04155 [Deltaproteobacteria bacterium RIFCSPHIGHO2_02_FULL_44_16]OGQ46373.1 MAG: hypothetical protein A3I05_07175 [Deltaproteobacteria bacterium RIFCSPLOWO2_02_FULL_44_10]
MFKSLKENAIFWIPFSLLILVLISIAVGYNTLHRESTSAFLERRVATAELAAMVLEERFSRLTDLGLSLATRTQLRKLVGKNKWKEAIELMKQVPKQFPFVTRVYLTDRKGTLMADAPHIRSTHGKNFSSRDWYKGVSRSWKQYLSVVSTRTGKPQLNVIAVATPIKLNDGKISGILVLQVPLDAFVAWAREVEVGPEEFVFFVDPQGNVVGHPHLSVQEGEIINLSAYPPVQHALAGEKGTLIERDIKKNKKIVISYAPVRRYQWGVIVQQPAEVALAQRNKNVTLFIIISAFIFLMSCFAMYGLIRILRSRQKKHEDRLRELIAIKSEFTSMVSHELRTPLTVIKEGMSMVVDETAGPLTASQKECLEAADRNIERLTRLINDVLDYQKLEAGEISLHVGEYHINELIEQMLPEIHSLAHRKNLLIVTKFAEQLPSLVLDRDKIVQVVLNFVSNAVKFSEKGTITLQTERTNNHIRVAVCDEGIGIPQEDISKLFQSFVQLTHSGGRKTGGSGLGLAICRKILEMHHGQIGVESVYGHGSTFWFLLPISDTKKPA